jgi:ATP-dependent Zn protease
MNDTGPEDLERIAIQVAAGVRDSPKRNRAIHEAGHAVIAHQLSVPLKSVDIEERETAEGVKFGRVTVQSIGETFSTKEIEEHAPSVVEHVRNRIIMLRAGEEATKLIRQCQNDKLAQFDQSEIRTLCRAFPEVAAVLQELINAAVQAVATHRADIQKLADALVERTRLDGDQVRQLLDDIASSRT